MSRRAVMTRGATTTPALSLFLVIVIATLSYLGVAAPGLLAEGRTATVRTAVETLPELSRWPSATQPGLPALDGASAGEAGVLTIPLAAVDQWRRAQPQPLRGLLGEPRMIAMLDPATTTDENPERTEPVPQNRVGLVADPGFAERSDLVEGRLPEVTDPADGIEIALTRTVAEQLAWPVGADRRWNDTTLRLTGTVEPADADAGDWDFIGGSMQPMIEVTPSGDRILIGAAFLHVDETTALADRVREFKITAWMPFDIAGVDAATAQAASAQLRLLSADPVMFPMYAETFFNRGLAFGSALPQTIDTGLARADAMTAVVTVAAVGPVAVALVVLALVSRLIAVRRVPATRVLQARGASTGRLTVLLGGEGATLGVLGAVAGAALAAVRPGWLSGWVLLVPFVLAAVPAVTLPWGALTEVRRQGRRDLGEESRAGSGRAALEILILAVTAALAVLIVVRGGAGGVDPLLLTLPVLLGAAGSILALRLLPVLLRSAERRGRTGVSLAALLGPARARRDPIVRTAPVLAVVVGLGVAVFSVAFAATVTGGISRAAIIGVGADVRVDASYIDEAGAGRVAAIDGVAAMAALRGDHSGEASAGTRKTRAHVYVIDREEFVAVQRDSVAALPLPAALAEPAAAEVPVVVSEGLMARLDVNDADELKISGTPVRIVGTAPSAVPFGTAEQWVIVDASNAGALGQRLSGIPQLYLALDPGADPDAVGRAAVAALGGDAAFETPAQVAAVHSDDPAFAVVQGALLAASAIVAALLSVAIVATLVLGAPSRARMLAILRTLGHPHRSSAALVTWEVAPALMLALPFGAAAGVAMAWLVIPQLDLRGFVGSPTQPPVLLGGVWPAVIVAGFAFVVAGAIAVAAVLASRLEPAGAIRSDEGEGQ